MEQPETSQRNNEDRAQQRDEDLPIWEYATQRRVGDQSCIRRPPIQANNFEIKSSTISLLSNVTFYGLSHEDPNEHISNFIDVCELSKYNGVSNDAIRLRLFPWTLKDKAKTWFNSLPAGSISTWEEMEAKFLDKFFPPAKTAKHKNDIVNFNQWDKETLYESWERFKELLRKCPHHGFQLWMQVQIFYNGLEFSAKHMLDAAAGGAIMKKRAQEAYDLIEDMSMSTYQYQSERGPMGRKEAKSIESIDLESLSNNIVAKVMKSMDQNFVKKGVKPNPISSISCLYCGSDEHNENDCQNKNENANEVNFVGNYRGGNQNNPYSNTYNPGWRNHPNFSWSNQGGQAKQGSGYQGQNNQGGREYQFQKPPNSNPPISNLNNSSSNFDNRMTRIEDALANLLNVQNSFMQETRLGFQNQNATIKGIETQIGQLATQFNRVQGTLPSQTEPNPREKVMMIKANEELQTETIEKNGEQSVDTKEEPKPVQSKEHQTVHIEAKPVAYEEVQAVDNDEHQTVSHEAKEVESHVEKVAKDPSLKVLDDELDKLEKEWDGKYIPPHVKRVKENLEHEKKKPLSLVPSDKREEMRRKTAQILKEHPRKIHKDKGSFSISCVLNGFNINNALCDLGASTNLISFFVCKKMGIYEEHMTPTTMKLQLADHTTITPIGIIENLTLKVGMFTFNLNFVVVDTKEEEGTVILGRPFLAQSRTKINVAKGKLTLRGEWGKKKEVFYMYKDKPKKMLGTKVVEEVMVVMLRSGKRPYEEAQWRSQADMKAKPKKKVNLTNCTIINLEEEFNIHAIKKEEDVCKARLEKEAKKVRKKKIKLERKRYDEIEEKIRKREREKEIPKKEVDHGPFRLRSNIGGIYFDNCLCDTGASTCMLSFSCFARLRYEDQNKLEPCDYDVKMADNHLSSPLGMMKNLIINIDGLNFPMDCIVMKGGLNDEELFILGRSFLKTSKANMDMAKGILTITNGEKIVEKQMYTYPKVPKDYFKNKSLAKRIEEFG